MCIRDSINPVQTTSAQTIVDTVSPSGTPIVFINREPEVSVLESYKGKCCYVGADARQSGTYPVSYTHLDVYKRQPP